MRTHTLILVLIFTLSKSEFVTREGNKLLLNNKPFRFAGCNIYWLGLDENYPAPNNIQYPSKFRVDDVFATAIEMGATVVRAHTLGVSTGRSLSYEPKLNEFNIDALNVMDYAVYRAGQLGLKLVIPMTDNYRYYHGGKHDFTDWRGISDENQFYYNQQVISDFKVYIKSLLTHKNMYSGVVFANDSTVMAWETGNELRSPASWTKTIADFIKSLDSNHLVLDGNYGINTDALSIPSVDLYSDHFYPMDPSRVQYDAKLVHDANKVFIIGEYQWPGSNLDQFLSTIENANVAGDAYWSLFGHADQYGYIDHKDGVTLHYPGDNADMMQRAQVLRAHAYKMSGLPVPAHQHVSAPLITVLEQQSIAWRGSAGADKYSVERSTAGANGPWTVVCDRCLTDYQLPWRSSEVVKGWYRVRGYNLDGVAGDYSGVKQL